MESNELVKLGFINNSKKINNEYFSEHRIDGDKISIEITGTSLVEITTGYSVWIEAPGCKTIEDVKELMRLFNFKEKLKP